MSEPVTNEGSLAKRTQNGDSSDGDALRGTPRMLAAREQMNIVIVGHVDHGKSTVVGRLLADTHSLPEGKLEAVRKECERTGKPFEYAFLLDALADEQDQGITIDTARSFSKPKNAITSSSMRRVTSSSSRI